MNRKQKFTIVTDWILLTRGYDTYATYQHTPDSAQYDYLIFGTFSISDTPYSYYEYFTLSKDTLREKGYVCDLTTNECHLSDDIFYVRTNSL